MAQHKDLNAQMFQIMFENIGEGVVFADEHDQICFINSAAESIRRIKAADYLGRHLLDMHPPRASERISVLLNKLRSREIPSSVRTIHIRGNFFENSYYPIRNEQEDYVGTLMVSRDVTEKNLLKEENQQLRQKLEGNSPTTIIGKSTQIRNVLDKVSATAHLDSTVLITGESGTGKELIATALHDQSLRYKRPFVKINCAALPENLIESELFGHVKGAFTGADRDRPGKFEQADQGTIFLDEIGEMPLAAQVKLLRVIQERVVQRIGGEKEIRVNVRIVAATNRDLKHLIQEQRFREDLYYRLHVIPIHVPALRERRDDILLLAEHFINKFVNQMGKDIIGLSSDAVQVLKFYDYPGNIRELENIIEYCVALCASNQLTRADLPAEFQNIVVTPALTRTEFPDELSLAEKLAIVERSLIEEVLSTTNGRKGQAAELLSISRKTLWDKMSKW